MQENLATLRRRGVHVLEPEAGRLAGGDVGAGRLADPERIVGRGARAARPRRPVRSPGRTVLVTAGGTREPIDPVRFVGNRSSGKMGHAVAGRGAAPGRAASCSSPPSSRPVAAGVEVVRGRDRRARCTTPCMRARRDAGRRSSWPRRSPTSGPRPSRPSKIEEGRRRARDRARADRSTSSPTLGAAQARRPGRGRLRGRDRATCASNAAAKLAAKRVDLIVANDVSAADAGFEVDTNRALLLDADGRRRGRCRC